MNLIKNVILKFNMNFDGKPIFKIKVKYVYIPKCFGNFSYVVIAI